jgi:hypothetical protein
VVIPRDIVAAILCCPKIPLVARVKDIFAVTSTLADGELHGLTVGDIELDGDVPTANVRQAARLIGAVGDLGEGRGGSPRGRGHALIGDPKNEFRKRTLPLHYAVVDALREWLRDGIEQQLGRPALATDPLFPGKGGRFSRPKSAKHLREDAATALEWQLTANERPLTDDERAAIQARCKPLTFHATRRTTLTWLKDMGVADAVRKRLAGHTGGGVTEEHYTRRELAELREAVHMIMVEWTPNLRDPRRPSAIDTVPGMVPPDTSATENATVSGAPGRNRTCDLRFRKTRPGSGAAVSGGRIAHVGDPRRPVRQRERPGRR